MLGILALIELELDMVDTLGATEGIQPDATRLDHMQGVMPLVTETIHVTERNGTVALEEVKALLWMLMPKPECAAEILLDYIRSQGAS